MDRINSDGIIEVEGKRLFTDGDPQKKQVKVQQSTLSFLMGFKRRFAALLKHRELT